MAEVANGRGAHVTFSYNPSTTKEKVKFILERSYSDYGVHRPCLLNAINTIKASLEGSIVTDKGHASTSKGQSIVEFWIKQVTCSSQLIEFQTDQSPGPTTEDIALAEISAADSMDIDDGDIDDESSGDEYYPDHSTVLFQVTGLPAASTSQDEILPKVISFLDAGDRARCEIKDIFKALQACYPDPQLAGKLRKMRSFYLRAVDERGG
jgi:hypothetical protein